MRMETIPRAGAVFIELNHISRPVAHHGHSKPWYGAGVFGSLRWLSDLAFIMHSHLVTAVRSPSRRTESNLLRQQPMGSPTVTCKRHFTGVVPQSEHPSSHLLQTTMVLQLLSVRRSLIDIEPIRRRHHAVRPVERAVTTVAGDI